MKHIFEYILKSLPIIIVAILSYMLFISRDSQITEGVKLTLSALLGAIASYIFIQYSEYLKKIDTIKSKHQRALNTLEVKLNDQLNWLSDIVFHLTNHEKLINKVISGEAELAYDASSYREPINIASEIFDITNLGYKNHLLSLHTLYIKIKNDLSSMHTGYKFMLDQAISNPDHKESYRMGLPYHLANIIMLRNFVEKAEGETKNALSMCRVLSKDSKNLISRFSRYLIIHSDPKNLQMLVSTEKSILEKEIEKTINDSQHEIDEIEKKLNN